MKKKIFITFILAISLLNGKASDTFTKNYKHDVFKHADALSRMGVRLTGTENEARAADYIIKQFKEAGLQTTVEPFEFITFSLNSTEFKLSDQTMIVEFICLNPYSSQTQYHGTALLYDKEKMNPENIAGKTIIAPSPATMPVTLTLMYYKASMLIYISPEDFKKASNLNEVSFSLSVKGEQSILHSKNIIGTLSAEETTDREIWITAHYDSYRSSPGANDNGTGIGSLIELAKIFRKDKLNCNLKFIAFGGEEVGLLGSRMYLEKHPNNLKHCQLVFNIDTVGGEGIICAETEGGITESFSHIGKNHFPEILNNKTWEDLNGQWRIMHPDILPPIIGASNVPEWLKQTVDASAKESNIEYTQSKGLFSDHRTFAQAGIPCTGVAQKTGSPTLHTPNDTSEKINKKQLEDAGILCHSVVFKTMNRF